MPPAKLVNLTSGIASLKTMVGYRDALNEIHLDYEHIDFKQRDIPRLHEIMLSVVGYEFGGQYKTDDNVFATSN